VKIWFNGALQSSRGLIDADDRGFLLGDGAFETIAVFDGRPAFLRRHLKRLKSGLEILHISPPQALDSVGDVIGDLAKANNIDGDAAARITISRGPGPRGLGAPNPRDLNISFAVSVAPAALARQSPSKIMISKRRRFTGSSFAGFKSIGNYGENILALDDARNAGADDAILLNEKGGLACASAANIFMIGADQTVATPRLADGAMPGIVRGVLLEAARAHGVEIIEREIAPGELAGAALFLTNSLIGLNEVILAPGAQRPMLTVAGARDLFKRLQSCYGEALAADLAASEIKT